MRAIEATGKLNGKGELRLDKPLNLKNKKVKVIILVPENDEMDELLWLKAAGKNPALDFLQEEQEIYSNKDGKPFKP